MPWINLTDDELEIVKKGLQREVGFHLLSSHVEETKAAQNVQKRISEQLQATPDAQAFIDAVSLSEPDELDDDPIVSRGDDGAYVMAWIWISNEDAGIDDTCCDCGEEGYNCYCGLDDEDEEE